MALLHLLLEWQRHLKLELAAIHINHQLRGKESEGDQKFVKNFCEERKIPVCLEKANIRKFAKENKYSLEEAGHILRERIYQQHLKEKNFNAVATAHNLNDQAETILMHILEGTGLEGLSGIYLQKQGIIRPLLFAERREIERYAREKNIPFREDSSNKDIRYKRNKIRHKLLPYLEREFSLSKLDNFLKMGMVLQEWSSYSNRLIEAFEKKVRVGNQKATFNANDYQKQFSGVQIKLLENILQRLSGVNTKLDYNTFNGFKLWLETAKEGTKFQLYPKVLARRHDKDLVFQKIPESPVKIKLEIPSENVYYLPGSEIRFILKEVQPEKVTFTRNHSVEFIDRAKIKFPLNLRNWKNGDRFQPLGSPHTRLVSDFLTDLKIEFPQKKNVLVLEQHGEIIAIPGYRISEKFKLTDKTKKALKIELRKNE